MPASICDEDLLPIVQAALVDGPEACSCPECIIAEKLGFGALDVVRFCWRAFLLAGMRERTLCLRAPTYVNGTLTSPTRLKSLVENHGSDGKITTGRATQRFDNRSGLLSPFFCSSVHRRNSKRLRIESFSSSQHVRCAARQRLGGEQQSGADKVRPRFLSVVDQAHIWRHFSGGRYTLSNC